MVTTLNYDLKDAPAELFDKCRWSLLTMFILHANVRNRCWPSMRGLAKRLDMSLPYITQAKQWLIEHEAIKLVSFKERVEDEKELPNHQHVYQLTGYVKFGEVKIQYLYIAPKNGDDVKRRETSKQVNDKPRETSKPGSMINSVNDQRGSPLTIPKEDSSIPKEIPLQPPAGASVAGAPEVAAKAVAPEAKRESGEAVKDKPAKKLKEPRVADPVFKWVCDYLGINADVAVQNNKHEAWGMKGYIVAEEKGRLKQSTPLSAEQLAAIAPHLPGFVPWYETQCKGCSLPTHKRFQVWIGKWYLAGRPNGKPTPATKRAADPNCPHCHGEGVVTTEDDRGYRTSKACSCVKEVRNG